MTETSPLEDSLIDKLTVDESERDISSDDDNDGDMIERVRLTLSVREVESSSVNVRTVALPSSVPLCEWDIVVVMESLSKRFRVEEGDGDCRETVSVELWLPLSEADADASLVQLLAVPVEEKEGLSSALHVSTDREADLDSERDGDGTDAVI